MDRFIAGVHTISRVCGTLAAICLASACIVVCQMVVIRYVLGASTVWQSEFVTFAIVAATLIGSRGVLAWTGWIYFYEAWSEGWVTSSVWAPPLWIPLLPLPLGLGLLTLQYTADFLCLVTGREAGSSETMPPEELE
jgi:TRAP-type C4-dicarboxylate transport system permease small subunit